MLYVHSSTIIDYLCILCYLQPDPYFSFPQDVRVDGSELLLQEERCFWAILRKKRLLLYCMLSLKKRAYEKHQKNAFDSFFGRKRSLALRTSAAPNTTNLLVLRVAFQSFNARSGTTRKLSPFTVTGNGALYLLMGTFSEQRAICLQMRVAF